MAEYIEREKALACFHDWIDRRGDVHTPDEMEEYRALESLHAADVRPVVRGEWGYRWKIHGDGRRPTELFPCSVCGFENTSATNFCPNCGADMREES